MEGRGGEEGGGGRGAEGGATEWKEQRGQVCSALGGGAHRSSTHVPRHGAVAAASKVFDGARPVVRGAGGGGRSGRAHGGQRWRGIDARGARGGRQGQDGQCDLPLAAVCAKMNGSCTEGNKILNQWLRRHKNIFSGMYGIVSFYNGSRGMASRN